jgi:hypothetical protein
VSGVITVKQRVTKDEACQRLGKSLATLDRMIKRDEVEIELEPQGSRHRVWVILEDEDVSSDIPSDVSPKMSDASELITLRERVRGLEELVSYYQQQLRDAEWRYGQLQANLTTAQNTLAAVTTRALPDPSTRSKRIWWPWRRNGEGQHQAAVQG